MAKWRGPARCHHLSCCPKSRVAYGDGGWGPRAATAARALGSSHSDLRVLSLGSRTRAFLARKQPSGGLTRPRPQGQQKERSEARGHKPLIRGAAPNHRGGSGSGSPQRVSIFLAHPAHRPLPGGLGGRCVHTADASAIRAPRTLGATRLLEERQSERTGSAAPHPTPIIT